MLVNKNYSLILKLSISSIFACLFCIFDVLSFRFATANVNICDVFLFISAWVLNDYFLFFAVIVGFGLGDLLSNFAVYIPISIFIRIIELYIFLFLIKIHQYNVKKYLKVSFFFIFIFFSQLLMISVYFVYDWLIFDKAIAVSNLVNANLLQAGIVIALCTFVYFFILAKTKY